MAEVPQVREHADGGLGQGAEHQPLDNRIDDQHETRNRSHRFDRSPSAEPNPAAVGEPADVGARTTPQYRRPFPQFWPLLGGERAIKASGR